MKKSIPLRTLVIDDDEQVCRTVQQWLLEARHEVFFFTDPQQGIELANKIACHLALVDLRLPDTPGKEIIATLSRLSPQMHIVAMSAFPDTPQVLEAVRAGARDVLTKPIQKDALLETLDRQLTQMGIFGHTEEEFNRRLGQRLRIVRQDAQRTVTDVAIASEITPAQLSQIELGKNATTTWTLARICSTLRQPLSKLFEEL